MPNRFRYAARSVVISGPTETIHSEVIGNDRFDGRSRGVPFLGSPIRLFAHYDFTSQKSNSYARKPHSRQAAFNSIGDIEQQTYFFFLLSLVCRGKLLVSFSTVEKKGINDSVSCFSPRILFKRFILHLVMQNAFLCDHNSLKSC